MALLSEITYNRIAKNPDLAKLVFINEHNESLVSNSLVNFKHTKTKIVTRWETTESKNVFPFTHVALLFRNNTIVISSIKPIERTENGYVNIDYEAA